jgi:lipoprotein-anchoring transpeptidase ErfK/SrfK
MKGWYESLAHSFMVLSFMTTALLVGVQLRSSAPNSAASMMLPPIATLPPQEDLSFQTVSPTRTGLAALLQSRLNPDPIAAQTKLLIRLSERQVYLYHNEQVAAQYPIAVGREGWETPTGKHQVISMQKDPTWRHPFTGEIVPAGIDNPLGSRWIGFWTDGVHQIGFHGTNQEDLIGQAASHGCVRMRDQDVQALFSQVAVGTSVEVQP